MSDKPTECACQARPAWAPINDDRVLEWAVVESGDWEELRQCPDCGAYWLQAWPEELEGWAILCRPQPAGAARLRDIDRIETIRGYCVARLAEHLGEIKEDKAKCAKVTCDRRQVRGTNLCIEHLIAQRFGRQYSRLDRNRTQSIPP